MRTASKRPTSTLAEGVMKTCLRLSLCLALLLPLRALAQARVAQSPAELSPQEIFRRVSPSVFIVEALGAKGEVVASGSGVAISPDVVVTNYHVIRNGVRVRIRRGAGTWPAAATYSSPDHDLCGLQVDSLQAPAVETRRSEGLQVGDKVYAVGAPEGLELTFTEGIVSALRAWPDGQIIQTTAAISHGSSGGGLFDSQGNLVGITTAMVEEGQALNFAVPGEWVLDLGLSSVVSAGLPEDSGRELRALASVLRGVEHLKTGQDQQAIEAFREALRLKPNFAVAWFELGGTYDIQGQFDKAVEAYQEALRLRPDFPEAWLLLGSAYEELRKSDKAIEAYREALRLKPELWLGWSGLGYSYLQAQQWGKAIEACQEALRLKPDESRAWYYLGLAYERLGQRDKAIEVYKQLKVRDPAMADKFSRQVLRW